MKEINEVKKLFKDYGLSRPLAENMVIEYNNFFYKTPNITGKYLFHNGEQSFEKNKQNYELIKKYFSHSCKIADTEFFEDPEYGCISKQEKIPGKIMCIKDLQDPNIQKEIIQLLEDNKKLWKNTGLFLDIL